MEDTKYIVFKREDWEDFCDNSQEIAPGAGTAWARGRALDDAVVIRTKDAFAGPALHCYAATMALYLNLSNINGDTADSLRRISDYFHERAMEADATFEWKLPD